MKITVARPFLLILLCGLALALPLATPATAAEAKPPAEQGPSPLQMEQALRRLDSDQWILQAEALNQLAEWKAADAVEPARRILSKGANPWVRGRAFVALARIIGDAVLDDAIDLADDKAADMRSAALKALAFIGSPKGAAAAKRRLTDECPAVRYEAAAAYASLKGADSWGLLESLLADPDVGMVVRVIKAVVHVDTPAARAKVIGLLESENPDVRIAAAETLGALHATEAISRLLGHMTTDADAAVRTACDGALLLFEPDALTQPLFEILRGENTALYPTALGLLARNPTDEVRDGIAELARNPVERYKPVLSTMLNLVASGDPNRHIDFVVRHTGKEYPPEIRAQAVEKLILCDKADHYTILRSLMLDPNSKVHGAAFGAVYKLDKEPPPGGFALYVRDLLLSENLSIQNNAIGMLARQRGSEPLAESAAALDPILGGKDHNLAMNVAKTVGYRATEKDCRILARAQGFITEWRIIGPFPSDQNLGGLATPYPPEAEVDFGKSYSSNQEFFGYGASFDAITALCGGVEKQALSLRPPWEPQSSFRAGRIAVTFPLSLPDRKGLTLSFFAGFQDNPQKGDGVKFEVLADGQPLMFIELTPKIEGWQHSMASLSAYAGKKIGLKFVVDSLASGQNDLVVIGEPRVLAGGATAFDLLKLADTASARTEVNRQEREVSWVPATVDHANGFLYLHYRFKDPHWSAAYAVADVDLPGEEKALVWFGADEAGRLWVNGEEQKLDGDVRGGTVEVTLRPGRNRLMVKTVTTSGEWYTGVRIMAPDGTRLQGLKVARKKKK